MQAKCSVGGAVLATRDCGRAGLDWPAVLVWVRGHYEGEDWNRWVERAEEGKGGEKEKTSGSFGREKGLGKQMFKWDSWEILPPRHYGKHSSTFHKNFHEAYLSTFCG